MGTACYPGSFDPMTVAHVAIVEAVLARPDVDAVHLVLSAEPLGKPGASTVDDRAAAAERCVAHLAGVEVRTTDHRLLADVAAGYDVLVVGADKWEQVHDVAWYGSETARDEALGRLPQLLVVPRAGGPPPAGVPVLAIDPAHGEVSSTAVRAGRAAWRASPRPDWPDQS